MEYQPNTKLLSDDTIIELFWERDERAISETDLKYGNYLFAIAFNILKNREDGEECLNDTYLKTWNAIPPAKPQVLRAFLAKIARTTALDRYDERNRQKRIPAELCESLSADFETFLTDTDLEKELEAKEIGRIISAYLDSVSDKKLYAFMSRYFFVMPLEEIARRMGCSLSWVNKTLASMKKELRARLEKEGIEV